ncbi:MAG: hypothetical protein Q8L53_00525 [Aestuariivirga sp.]|nr:hypothetical protein [Aestuariivirga sp.]
MFTSTRKNMVMTGGSRRFGKMLNGVLKALGRTDKAIRRTAIIILALSTAAISLFGMSVRPGQAAETTIEPMPAKLETRFALSALPPALRDQASVYLLDPKKGYQLSRQGTSGVTCLVERTAWELADFRDDIYIPLCYDAVGTRTYLQVIMDTAGLRAQGISPAALKTEIENRFRNKAYKAPEKAGLSYMVAPIFRTVGPPDMKVHAMAMPHVMFYAPNITNEDIGALPNLSSHSSLLYPFIDKQGIAEQSYMIQLIGEAEKAKIMADEKKLLDDLCAYRDVLCLPNTGH